MTHFVYLPTQTNDNMYVHMYTIAFAQKLSMYIELCVYVIVCSNHNTFATSQSTCIFNLILYNIHKLTLCTQNTDTVPSLGTLQVSSNHVPRFRDSLLEVRQMHARMPDRCQPTAVMIERFEVEELRLKHIHTKA